MHARAYGLELTRDSESVAAASENSLPVPGFLFTLDAVIDVLCVLYVSCRMLLLGRVFGPCVAFDVLCRNLLVAEACSFVLNCRVGCCPFLL